MRFEKQIDINREQKAIKMFVSPFKGGFLKLGDNDIDFIVSNAKGENIAYVEVKGRLKDMQNAFPLPISVKKLTKLLDKKLNPVIIWACNDGIIYAKLNEIKGIIKIGGRKPRFGSSNDIELMAYYEDNNNFKKIKNK